MPEPLPSLRLPEARDVEIVLIKLADGTIVARAKHEVEDQVSRPKEGS